MTCPKITKILLIKEKSEDYVRHIHRDILSGPNSNLNSFIERNKDDWNTGTESLEGYLIPNSTEKYSNILAAK